MSSSLLPSADVPVAAAESVQAPSLVRFASIDALRGFAALWVLVFHSRELIWVGLSEWRTLRPALGIDAVLGWASLPFRYGGWAVMLFFVISGYCIHRPHAMKAASDPGYRIAIGTYLVRRLRRIYPVLFGCLVFTLVVDAATRALAPDNASVVQKLGDHSAFCFFGNLGTLQDLVCPIYGSNVVLWSLGIEIHLYLAYLLVFPLFRRRGIAFVLATVAVVSLVGQWLLFAAGLPALGLFDYGLSWVIGACVAQAEVKRVAPPLKLLAVASVMGLAFVAVLEAKSSARLTAIPGFGAIAPTVLSLPFATAVWFAAVRPHSAVWGWRPVGWLAVVGVFSYSLYSIHAPILLFLRAWLNHGDRSVAFWPVLPAAAVCVPAAYLFYQAVERWSLPKQHR